MRHVVSLIASLLVAAAPAAAQETAERWVPAEGAEETEAPPPPARPLPPRWSIGAGLGFAIYDHAPTIFYAASTTPIARAPVVTTSVERRAGERSWLVFGVYGTMTRRDWGDAQTQAYQRTGDEFVEAALTLGLRQVLSPAGAPVDVSLLALADGGYAHTEFLYADVTPGSTLTQRARSWLVGASLGIAVDRELAPGLLLRVASPLAGVRSARSRVDAPGLTAETTRELSVRALLAPSLELRVAF
jgi:hypothetical protein